MYLTSEFHKDLAWFLVFLRQFNGITYIKKPDIPYNHTLHVDTCLPGLAGVWNNQVYATPIFDIYGIEFKIVHLEMLNLLIALKLWAHEWSHSVVKFFCDNLAVVQVVRTGKTRDNMLSLCLRNIWLITATHAIDLHIEHIQGRSNKIAALLSRLYPPKPVDTEFLQTLSKSHIWHKIPIHSFNLNFIILIKSACVRIQHAFRPSTASAYTLHFKTFLAFLIIMDLPIACNVQNILTFMEFLY